MSGPPRRSLPFRPESQRPTLAVLDFAVPQDSNGELAGALSDVCRRTIQESGQFTLIDREQMKKVLGERDFVALMRCEEMACRVQYARLLAAEKLVLARVNSAAGTDVLYMSLTDVGSGRVDANVLGYAGNKQDLIPLVVGKTWELIEQAIATQAPAPSE